MRFSAASESNAANVLTFGRVEGIENVGVGGVVLTRDAHLIDPETASDHQLAGLRTEIETEMIAFRRSRGSAIAAAPVTRISATTPSIGAAHPARGTPRPAIAPFAARNLQRHRGLRMHRLRHTRTGMQCRQSSHGLGASAHRTPATRTAAHLLSVATRVLDHPSDEVTERPAGVPRQLRHEGGPRHARLRIDFEADQLAGSAGRVVVAEVGPRHAAAAQRLMRP